MRRYVSRGPYKNRQVPMPRGSYRDPKTFIGEDGTTYTVTSGKMPGPLWPNGSTKHERTTGHPVVRP